MFKCLHFLESKCLYFDWNFKEIGSVFIDVYGGAPVIFCPPRIWPRLPFYSDLVGFHFEALHFQHVDNLFAPKIDQIYHFIRILLDPILNFERRTPTDFELNLTRSAPRPPGRMGI